MHSNRIHFEDSIKKLTIMNMITFFLLLCLFFLSFSCFKIFPKLGKEDNPQHINSNSIKQNKINSYRNLDKEECIIKLFSNIEYISKDKYNEIDDKLIVGKYIPTYLYEHSKIEDEQIKYYHSNNSKEEGYPNSRSITKREVDIYVVDGYIFKPTYTTFNSNAYNETEESCIEGYKSCGYIKGGCKVKLLCVDEKDDCPIKYIDSQINSPYYNITSYIKEDTISIVLSAFCLLNLNRKYGGYKITCHHPFPLSMSYYSRFNHSYKEIKKENNLEETYDDDNDLYFLGNVFIYFESFIRKECPFLYPEEKKENNTNNQNSKNDTNKKNETQINNETQIKNQTQNDNKTQNYNENQSDKVIHTNKEYIEEFKYPNKFHINNVEYFLCNDNIDLDFKNNMKKKFDRVFICTLIFIIISMCFRGFDLATINFDPTSTKIFLWFILRILDVLFDLIILCLDLSLISEYNFSLEKKLCINYNPMNHIFLISICIILFILHICILMLILKSQTIFSLEK